MIFFGGLFVGLGLLGWAAVSPEPPVWAWVVGGLLTAFFGYNVASAVVFRLRYRTPEERDAARERLLMGPDGHAREEARGILAKQATTYTDEVLRIGRTATGVVVFAADGNHEHDTRRLAYLELDVSAYGAKPHRVRTGDWVAPATLRALVPGVALEVKVDPADPDRVAVDWPRSLPRLQQATPAAGSGPMTIVL
ncbi:hypothetical protein N867_12720 [Actinotalea fermentans ATCC 43279 = JCM 9966 = DSM 3133]|nr:hypothetical protein N867_12720 [Actinotalea fermentans ATCC 43279 = JCM 9966 = DSM 3133]